MPLFIPVHPLSVEASEESVLLECPPALEVSFAKKFGDGDEECDEWVDELDGDLIGAG